MEIELHLTHDYQGYYFQEDKIKLSLSNIQQEADFIQRDFLAHFIEITDHELAHGFIENSMSGSILRNLWKERSKCNSNDITSPAGLEIRQSSYHNLIDEKIADQFSGRDPRNFKSLIKRSVGLKFGWRI